jgi:predicted Abi (CAAX) family protease
MDKLKQYGPIGAAAVVVSGIAGYLLPVPHAYSQIYIVIAIIGAFLGYGLAALFVARASGWHVVGLIVVAVSSLVVGIVCGFGYFNLFWLDQSPPLGMRIVHALLYGFTFALFFFAARWAGLFFAKKDSDT